MKRINITDKKYIITLFIISSISFFSNIWVRTADLMEQRNFITAREMVKSGEYLVTTLNGNLRFEKPPFPTWLTGLIMKITNNFSDEWILRIPAALTGILMVFLIYYLVNILTDDSTKAFLSGFIASTMFMLIKISNENTWDIYTYVFALGFIVLLLYGFKKEKLTYYIESGVFLAISIMSKGPVGIYGLVLPFIIAYIASFGKEDFKKNWKRILLAVTIGLIMSAVWPLAMYIKYPEYFVKIMEKEQSTWSNSHTKSIIFYLDYFVYTGIWIFFTVIALFNNSKQMKKNNYSKFLILWNGIVLLLLSFVSMKKKRYGIPIYMVTTLNVGVLCEYFKNTIWENMKKYEKVLLYIQGGFVVLVSLGVSVLFLIESIYRKNLSVLYTIFSIVIYCSIIYLVVNIFKNKKSNIGNLMVVLSGVFMIWININASWFIDTNYVEKQKKRDFSESKILQKNPPALDIFSTEYSVDEIWNVGKEIKDLNINTISHLPENFIVLGQVPSEITNSYNIYTNMVFSKDDGNILKLYYLNRKENLYESDDKWYEKPEFRPTEEKNSLNK